MRHIGLKDARRQRTITRIFPHFKITITLDEDLRRIGQEAFQRGGLAEMRKVFYELSAQGLDVGYAFDGIGGWYR